MGSSLELGFPDENTPRWQLLSKYFPSKVGGKPAWLNLRNLPSQSELLCTKCARPMALLLQTYAPVDELECCFHRTIFLFVCLNPSCCVKNDSSNFAVFRCQLGRRNEFYSYESPKPDEKSAEPSANDYMPLCEVCGCRGPQRCGKCKVIHYCSKEHQVLDWKSGHKMSCSQGSTAARIPNSKAVLPEFEIVTEAEDLSDADEDEGAADDTTKCGSSGTCSGAEEFDEAELVSVAYKGDKQFRKFQKMVFLKPDQILRYHRGETPLWVSSENIPGHAEIPNCGACGSYRQFEFQVMPQLLNHLGLDSTDESLDWGTLAVYTCAKNCGGEKAYWKEFVWKQDFSEENVASSTR